MNKEVLMKARPALIVCAVCVVIGAIAWIMMLSTGLLQTTGMGNIFNWGLLIVIFAFLVGFGAGSQLVASMIYLRGRENLLPFAPIAQVIALGGAIGAGVAILADLGNPFHILSMLVHPNVSSPLVWDMVALTTFIIVALICTIALKRGWKNTKVWMIIGFVAAIALQLVEGLLFALENARIWWHSWVEPIDFLAVAFVCGLAIMTLIAACSAKKDSNLDASREFAQGLFWAVLIHICLSILEVIMLSVEASTSAGAESALTILINYIWLYLIELLVPLGAAIALRFRLDDASKTKLIVCSALVIFGMLAHRLMLLYPALGGSTLFTSLSNQSSPAWMYPTSTGFLASAQQTFAMTQAYVPGLVECVSILLPIGLAALIAILGVAFVEKGADK